MANPDGDEPPHIDGSLDPIRAAISLVADGSALRVTVYAPARASLLPATRILARAAGVVIESVEGPDLEADLSAARAPLRIA